MKNRGAAVVVLLVGLVGVGIWWWQSRDARDTPATSTITQPGGSAKARVPSTNAPGSEPARLAVKVTDEHGPIAEATVRLAPEDGEVLVLATGADGIARADQLAPGAWAISASAPGHEPAALPGQELAAGDDQQVALTLAIGGRMLTGVVTDVSGGPIAGARIDAAKLGGMARPDRAVATALTGNDGRYQVAVAEGQLLVAARSPDYAAQSRMVEVGASGATADFALVPGGVIEGIVRDEITREPIPGAIVEAGRDRAAIMLAEAGGHHVVAAADGRFRITGLRPGVYELDARSPARSSKAATIVGLGVAEQLSEVEILVGVGPAVRGKVVDQAGTPIGGAEITAMGSRRNGGDATTNDQGEFVITGLPAGSYLLFARADAHVPGRPVPVELVEEDVDGVIVTVQRGITIKGHVEPRQVAEVRIAPAQRALGRGIPMLLSPITTGPDGAFELPSMLAGEAILSARCPSGAQGSRSIAVKEGMPEIVLEVTAGASIAGKVVDGRGKPVANVTVMATEQSGREHTMIVNGMITSGVQGLTDASGAYELRGLSAGIYRVSPLDRGRPMTLRGKPPKVTLAATDHKTGIDLAVDRPTGVIQGVVTGPDGTPLADAWVSVHQDLRSMIESMVDAREQGESRMMRVEARGDDDGTGISSDFPPALTDAEGRFAIRGLPHAVFEVVAEAEAGKLRGRASKITPDATITIPIAGVTSLSGTVTGPKGPAALFTVELEGPTRAQRTFTGGTFELGRVDPGAYTVRIRSHDGNAEARVEVAPGRPARVEIVLAANAVVVGTLVDAAGDPIANLPVTVIADHGDGQARVSITGPPPTSGPDGTFRVEHEAGPSMLVVMGGPRPVIKKGLALEAGKTLDVGEVVVDGSPAPP